MANWSLKVGHWRGVPIRVHASTPVGLYVFSGFRFDPVWWACALGLVLLHELGHALVVRMVGGRATEVMLTGFGGHCAWTGEVSPLGRAAIACGGVAAQLVLLIMALVANGLGLVPASGVANTVLWAATMSNAWLIGINLLPISPLDGAEAWAFPYRLGQVARRKLTTHRNVVRLDGDPMETGEAGAKEQAKNLAAQLLENARKEEDEP